MKNYLLYVAIYGMLLFSFQNARAQCSPDTVAPIASSNSLADITGECSVNVSTTPTATDNCAGLINATTNDPLTYFTQGTHLITWIYNDGNGNASTQTQSVIVNDPMAPLPILSSLPDLISDCNLIVSTIPTATDNCAGLINATTNDPLTYYTLGTHIITWTYNDGNGNISTQSQNVIVNDTTDPVPTVSTIPDVASECSATVTSVPTATDNCSGVITGTTSDALTYSTIGTHIITWTYNDGNGNTSTQTQNVIVNDLSIPIANASSLPDVTGECSATISTIPTATDNCAGLINGAASGPLTYNSLGTHVVLWTYNDGHGNISTQTQNVIVSDLTAPISSVSNLPDVTGECVATVSVIPTATDNCTGLINGIPSGPLTYNTLGTHVIAWTYSDGNGNSTVQAQNVIVTDDATAPVANLVSLTDILSECYAAVVSPPTATDNCSGVITGTTSDPLTYDTIGTHLITWIYNDGNGNISTQTQNVIVNDITAPVPTVATLPDIKSECSVAVISVPTAVDNCAGVITGTTSDALTYSTIGTHVIIWAYNDGHGNITTQIQNVIVNDSTAPLANISILPDVTGQCSVNVSVVPTATDNCAGIINATTNDPLSYSTAGTHIITWIYTDGNGNTSTQTQKAIVANAAPVLNSYTMSPGNGVLTISITQIAGQTNETTWYLSGSNNAIIASGEFGSTIITHSYAPGPYTFYASTSGEFNDNQLVFSIACNGTTILTGSLTGGESKSYSGIVSCDSITSYSLPSITGQCSAGIISIPTATDSCTGSVSGTTTNSLFYTTPGTHTITWLFNDGDGNVSTAIQNIIVLDTIAPVPTLISLPDITGACSLVVNTIPTATDNCKGLISASTTDSLNYSTQGTHIITWNYNDGNGNISTQSQKIILEDVSAPIADAASLPDIIGFCSADVNTVPTATDICSGLIIGTTTDSLIYTSQGIHVITWTFNDGNGNSSSQSQNLIVTGATITADSILLPDIIGTCSATVNFVPTATSVCYGTLVGTTIDSLIYTTQGINVITWVFNDGNGNSLIQTQNVIITDALIVADSLTLPDVIGECSASITNVPTAKSLCAGIISGNTSDSLTYDTQGTHVINWSYNDGNGNILIQPQNIIIKDISAPVADSLQLPDIIEACSATIHSFPTATDNCVQTKVVIYDIPLSQLVNLNTNCGTTFAYSNGGANNPWGIFWSSSETGFATEVKVELHEGIGCGLLPRSISLNGITQGTIPGHVDCFCDPTTFQDDVINMNPDNYISNGNNTVMINASNGLEGLSPNASWNNAYARVTVTYGVRTSTNDPLTYSSQGTHIINWIYDDGNGNVSTQTQRVIITDAALTPDSTSLPDITGTCSIIVTNIPTASSSCAGSIAGTTTDSLSYSSQGTHIITWLFDDGNGNTVNQTQNVIITGASLVPNDTTLPVLTASCAITVTTIPTANSICSGTIQATTTDSLTYSTPGTYTITWNYDDNNGNILTQAQTVIINTSSIIPDISTLPAITGQCSASISTYPTATSACYGTIVGSTTSPLSYSSQGTHVVTWTYNDGNGSTVTQTQNVIVNTFVDTSLTITGSTFTANASGAYYIWFDCAMDTVFSEEIYQSFTPEVSGSYALIISQSGCVDTSACYQINIIGIQEYLNEYSFSIVTDDVNNQFIIESGKATNIAILNILGQELMNKKIENRLIINSSGFENGIYFLRDMDNGITIKFIKE